MSAVPVHPGLAKKVVHKVRCVPLDGVRLAAQMACQIPVDAVVVHVGHQYGTLTLWYEHDTSCVDTELRTYHVLHTGDEVRAGWRHVKTLLTDGGNYVLHIYEESK